MGKQKTGVNEFAPIKISASSTVWVLGTKWCPKQGLGPREASKFLKKRRVTVASPSLREI